MRTIVGIAAAVAVIALSMHYQGHGAFWNWFGQGVVEPQQNRNERAYLNDIRRLRLVVTAGIDRGTLTPRNTRDALALAQLIEPPDRVEKRHERVIRDLAVIADFYETPIGRDAFMKATLDFATQTAEIERLLA